MYQGVNAEFLLHMKFIITTQTGAAASVVVEHNILAQVNVINTSMIMSIRSVGEK